MKKFYNLEPSMQRVNVIVSGCRNEGLDALFQHNAIVTLQEVLSMNDTIRFRVYEVNIQSKSIDTLHGYHLCMILLHSEPICFVYRILS